MGADVADTAASARALRVGAPGRLFLAIFLDIFTRKIVGFAADDHMRAELILEALGMALTQQEVKPGETIAHTDRGSQYAAEKYREKMNLVGIVASMSRKGNCWDNAHCESFFHSLKTELVYRTENKTTFKRREKSCCGTRQNYFREKIKTL